MAKGKYFQKALIMHFMKAQLDYDILIFYIQNIDYGK